MRMLLLGIAAMTGVALYAIPSASALPVNAGAISESATVTSSIADTSYYYHHHRYHHRRCWWGHYRRHCRYW